MWTVVPFDSSHLNNPRVVFSSASQLLIYRLRRHGFRTLTFLTRFRLIGGVSPLIFIRTQTEDRLRVPLRLHRTTKDGTSSMDLDYDYVDNLGTTVVDSPGVLSFVSASSGDRDGPFLIQISSGFNLDFGDSHVSHGLDFVSSSFVVTESTHRVQRRSPRGPFIVPDPRDNQPSTTIEKPTYYPNIVKTLRWFVVIIV